MHRTSAGILVVVLAFASIARSADVTLADAKADFDAAQYQPCLQKISRALQTRDAAAPDSPLRCDLFMLRGECLLQMKQGASAADAFRMAARIVDKSDDLHRLSAASAMVTLITASRNLVYTPKPPADSGPINIVPLDSRKQAMTALYNDRLAAAKPKIDAATDSTSLAPINDLLPALRDLYLIEDASTGDTAQTKPLLTSLGEHARKLINSELTRLSRRIEFISEAASEPTYVDYSSSQVYNRRGLSSTDQDELRDACNYLEKIAKVSQQGRWINRRLGGTGEVWDGILADCEQLHDDAQQQLDRR